MSLIHRYLIRELLPPFIVGVLLFTSVLLLTDLLELTELVVSKGIPVSKVIWGVLLQIPSSFVFSFPMALIMAIIMTYGRMAHDNELLVLRTSGFSVRSLSIPSIALAGVLSVSLLIFHQFGLPQLKTYRRHWIQTIKVTNPANLIRPKTYLEIPPYTIYAEKIDGQTMHNLYLEDRSYQPPRVIYSKRGRWIHRSDGAVTLKLQDGTVHQSVEDGGYRVLKFQSQTIQFNQESRNPDEHIEPAPTLVQQYRRYMKAYSRINSHRTNSSQGNHSNQTQRTNKGTKILEKYRRLATDFHRTIALSFASLFLVFVTVPAGILSKKSGKTISLVFSLGVITLYYLILSVTEPLAMNGWLPPSVSLWSPNLIFGMGGIFLYWNLDRI